MKGTLALWYEPSSTAPGAPSVRPEAELHFNVWRDLPTWINWLDVGFDLGNTSAFSRFYLFVPARLDRTHISDLSRELRVGNTLNAVFNDVVMVGAEADTHYQARLRGAKPFAIFHIEEDDLEVEDWQDGQAPGTRIVFTEKFCAKLAQAQTARCYIRLRVALVGPAADLFSSELQSGDKLFQAAVDKLEVNEFRLNERRSYPRRVAEVADNNDFRINTIHYFLIRNLGHQLLEQHAPFRKVRRLEPDLWTSYLACGDSAKVSALKPALVSRFVIYHWKAREPENDSNGIKDFIAFASFRTSSAGLIVYALGILLLGAAGNFLANGLLFFFPKLLPALLWVPAGAGGNLQLALFNFELLGYLVITVICIAWVVSWLESPTRWFRETFRGTRLRFIDLKRRWLTRSVKADE